MRSRRQQLWQFRWASILCIGLLSFCTLPLFAQIIPPGERAIFEHAPAAFRRYTVPSQCTVASARTSAMVWRAPTLRDTLTYIADLTADTLPSVGTQAIEQCLSQLTSPHNAFHREQQITLAKLYLLVRRDSMAQQLLNSVLVEMVTPTNPSRWWWFDRAMSVYLEAKPFKSEPLLHVRKQLDPQLWDYRYAVDRRIRGHDRALGDFAAAADVSQNMIREIQHRVILMSHPSANSTPTWNDSIEIWPVLDALFETHSDIAVAKGVAAARPVLDTFRHTITMMNRDPDAPLAQELRTGMGPFSGLIPIWANHYSMGDSVFRQGIAIPAPIVHGDLWGRRPDTLTRPHSGRVTLIINGSNILRFEGGRGVGIVMQMVAVLQRLHKQYAPAGLDIVWFAPSKGFFRSSGVLTLQEEHDAISTYLFDYLKAPGILAFEETPFTLRHDGKRLAEPTLNLHAFGTLSSRFGGILQGSYLVDRKGNIISLYRSLSLDKMKMDEAVLAKLIQRAL